MKGPSLQFDLRILRQWRCPACARTVRLPGRTTAHTCGCRDEQLFMVLEEVQQPFVFDLSRYTDDLEEAKPEDDDSGPDGLEEATARVLAEIAARVDQASRTSRPDYSGQFIEADADEPAGADLMEMPIAALSGRVDVDPQEALTASDLRPHRVGVERLLQENAASDPAGLLETAEPSGTVEVSEEATGNRRSRSRRRRRRKAEAASTGSPDVSMNAEAAAAAEAMMSVAVGHRSADLTVPDLSDPGASGADSSGPRRRQRRRRVRRRGRPGQSRPDAGGDQKTAEGEPVTE